MIVMSGIITCVLSEAYPGVKSLLQARMRYPICGVIRDDNARVGTLKGYQVQYCQRIVQKSLQDFQRYH